MTLRQTSKPNNSCLSFLKTLCIADVYCFCLSLYFWSLLHVVSVKLISALSPSSFLLAGDSGAAEQKLQPLGSVMGKCPSCVLDLQNFQEKWYLFRGVKWVAKLVSRLHFSLYLGLPWGGSPVFVPLLLFPCVPCPFSLFSQPHDCCFLCHWGFLILARCLCSGYLSTASHLTLWKQRPCQFCVLPTPSGILLNKKWFLLSLNFPFKVAKTWHLVGLSPIMPVFGQTSHCGPIHYGQCPAGPPAGNWKHPESWKYNSFSANKLWWADPDTAPMIPASWYSCPCVIPSPCMLAASGDLLLTKRTQQKWWDVTFMIRLQKTFIQLDSFDFSTCTFWWGNLPCSRSMWQGTEGFCQCPQGTKALNPAAARNLVL